MRLTSMCAVVLLAASAEATTLERLHLDEMIQKSTEIVRGRVTSIGSVKRGSLIYTQARVSVSERWKGAGGPSVEVNIPGGVYGRERMTISGAPQLRAGYEYVLFLWRGASGIAQVIGFSQGVFDLKVESSSETVAYRAASTETVLDGKTGEPVVDTPVRMRVSDLRERVRQVLAKARE